MELTKEHAVSFEQVGELSEDVYFIYDQNSAVFSYINAACVSVLQMTPAVLQGNPELLFDVVHPEDRSYVLDFLEHALKSSKSGKIEFRILVPENLKKYILLEIFPLEKTRNSHLIAGTAVDITTTKSNILYAEKINARKNSTLEILAHDLKGPIGMISMMAGAIQKISQQKGDETLSQYVDLIQSLCIRNIDLIRDLVNQEFLESTEVDLRKERSDIVWGLSDVLEQYKKSSDIILKKFNFNSSAEKLYIEMDALKLMQVFNNLISNAIKFTPDNGVISVDILEQEDAVLVKVSDNGIGIPEELHPYLFDKFTRARRKGLRGEVAVGLGMSIIKTIVELHAGRIWFESAKDKGSTFYIEVPK